MTTPFLSTLPMLRSASARRYVSFEAGVTYG